MKTKASIFKPDHEQDAPQRLRKWEAVLRTLEALPEWDRSISHQDYTDEVQGRVKRAKMDIAYQQSQEASDMERGVKKLLAKYSKKSPATTAIAAGQGNSSNNKKQNNDKAK
jgi:hypothetical protein